MKISKSELKFVKSLKLKKSRHLERSFLVEGAKNVLELLDSTFVVDYVIGTESFLESNDLKGQKNIKIRTVSSSELGSISTLKTTNSCIAVAKIPETPKLRRGEVSIVLDGVNDPGNLGTIIRSLDWFGFDQVICSLDTADFFNPKTISSTMGSFTRVTAHYLDLETFFASNEDQEVYSMDLKGDPLDRAVIKEGIIILGSESHGVRDNLRKFITQELSITKYGRAESLNVAQAATILFYQLRRP